MSDIQKPELPVVVSESRRYPGAIEVPKDYPAEEAMELSRRFGKPVVMVLQPYRDSDFLADAKTMIKALASHLTGIEPFFCEYMLDGTLKVLTNAKLPDSVVERVRAAAGRQGIDVYFGPARSKEHLEEVKR